MKRWISVKNRIPPAHEGDGKPKEYLVWREGFTGPNEDKNGYELLTMQNQASWHCWNRGYGFGITHWSELLDPPSKAVQP